MVKQNKSEKYTFEEWIKILDKQKKSKVKSKKVEKKKLPKKQTFDKWLEQTEKKRKQKAQKKNNYADFEFEIEEQVDVKTKKPVKLTLNFKKIYDPFLVSPKGKVVLTEDEYKKQKRSARKKSKAKAKKIKKKPLKISGKKRLHWSNGKFVSNAEMEGLKELAKKKKTTAKKLASKHQQGQGCR